ncbi:MAG TPA: PP2C family protein-serine/threonine phosphatase [Kofleriaceae bacterium]|nr:PP2C family protein-serine/threonine phosphatase [Kofleriaceae bacterium]
MRELWSITSYEPHLLSLLFALAPAALLIVIAYAGVMRGAPMLRTFLLAHCASLLPYATVMMLSPSIVSPGVAERLFRIAIAFIPLACVTGVGFQVSLIGKYRRYRWVMRLSLVNAAVSLTVIATTRAVIDGVRQLPGFWYAHAGPWAWLALLHTLLLTLPGFVTLGHAAVTSPPSDERRQLRATLIANLVTFAALSDIGLAYGVGRVPLGWLLSAVGSLLVVRALIVEDLLRVRAVDTGPPLLVAYFAAGTLLAWAALAALAAPIPWPLTTLVLVVCFAAVRVAVATVSLVSRGARGGDGPLDRLLAQLAGRARALTAPDAIAALAIDVIELGLGIPPIVLLASPRDAGWTTPAGDRLDEARAPDPRLAGWLAGHHDLVFADDLDGVPAEVRPGLAALLASHAARALVPIGSADELLGLLMIPAAARRLRGPALGFVTRAAERLADALLHGRLAVRAAERAAIAREVELAATVQAALLPAAGPHVRGAVTVVGSWQPATRCSGDFWTVTPLGDAAGSDEAPVLIVIGDVTGHGVASAMVTAAAIGACEVCVRRRGRELDLVELIAALDTAVRRVGGGGYAMTCAAAIVDPARREIRFASRGHTATYLCRPASAIAEEPPGRAGHGGNLEGERPIELHALVGRGNPLGTGVPEATRVHHRALRDGDLVVWYTDGVVDAQDPSGVPFGDRRLQHLLKRLDRRRLTPEAVHELVQRGVAAHRAGRPLADDETLVVAQLGPPRREAAP